MPPQYARALDDLLGGARNWPMWSRLGWLEIKRRYRRTAIGPFLTAFNLAILVFSVGFLWAALFGQPVATYMPYLSAGVLVWHLIANIIGEAGTVFTSRQNLLTTIRIPLMLLVTTMVWRNLIVFFHNLVVFAVVMLIWKVPLTWDTPLFIFGLVLLAANGLWVGIVIGIIATRFRDLPHLISGFLQILMFVTPVMWSRDILTGNERLAHLIDYNPLYHIIEVVRAPLLGDAPSSASWIVATLSVVVGGGASFYVFSRFRQRIVYWL
jgi:ABC-type polysaccharide/polyol phosphate export permease